MANNQTTQEAAQALGFESLNGIAFGRWQGYAVSHYMNQNWYSFQFAARVDKKDAQLRKTLLEDMKARCPKRCKGVMLDHSYVMFNMSLDRKLQLSEQMTVFMNAMADALRAAGVQPAATCAHCGGQTPDSLCLVKTSFQPVHAACVRNVKEEAVEKAQQNEEAGSYLTGTLGAILGTLVGIIPSVLTILYMERIYALLFALVPLAAMFGYRLFKGKQTKASIAIIIVLSILGVYVLQSAVVVISVAQETGFTVGEAASDVIPYLLTGEGITDVVSNSVMEFLFMALGFFFAWRYLAQTNTGKVAAAEAVASTLRPINTQN